MDAPTVCRSFDPVWREDAVVLILGSMPGQESLRRREYYAHPQNLFWRFMAEILEIDRSSAYEKRLAALKERKVALWDVAQCCERPGSLDAAIKRPTVIPNDLSALIGKSPALRAIFFNGRKAEELFHRYFLKTNEWPLPSRIALFVLPSTSPANASVNKAAKLHRWLKIKDVLDG